MDLSWGSVHTVGAVFLLDSTIGQSSQESFSTMNDLLKNMLSCERPHITTWISLYGEYGERPGVPQDCTELFRGST